MLDIIMKILGKENLKNIKIQNKFKRHQPKWTKMLDKEAFYTKYGMFEQPIVVDKDNVLIDGYTTYILASKMGRKYMSVKRT